MVSPSKPNHSRVASQQQQHKCKLIKGPKPLTYFKFYLDIGKHHIETRIERLIKELGGSIEFFLAKDVTHFVTDKSYDRDGKLLNGHSASSYLSPASLFLSQAQKTPSPAPKSSLLLLSNDITSSDEKITSSKPKSRADAMVQRARTTTTIQQPQHSIAKSPIDGHHVQCATSPNLSQNPVQLAQAWGTPIWSTEHTLKFLEKVSLTIKAENQSAQTKNSHNHQSHSHHPHQNPHHHHHHHRASSHVKHFHGNYLKIEARQQFFRPYYQEIALWPQLKLDCASGPFEDGVAGSNIHSRQPYKQTAVAPAAINQTPKRSKGSHSNPNVKTVNALSPIEPATISILARNNINSIIESTMTRKTRNKPVRETVDACNIKTGNDHDVKSNSDKCGYCEKCRVEYDVLSIHLQSKEHLNFVQNNDNYIAIDNLINSGTNVETFLRLNRDTEKNGIHNPKRLKDYLNHHNSFEEDISGEDTANLKSPKQMNGVHREEDLSPTKLSRLPKYSPPITRRSHSKNSSQLNLAADDDNHFGSDATNVKNHSSLDDGENLFPGTDTNISNKSPSTKAVNGKKKCDDTKPAEAIIDDSPVPEKRLVRAFPRYKVIGDGEETILNRFEKSPKQYAGPKQLQSTVTTSTTATTTTTTSTTKRKQAEADAAAKNKDLIVKFKRVRESELSKLTVEADNFMFPKPRDEILTDEDRQSTSERDDDQSSDVLSSEIGSMNNTLNMSHNSSLNDSSISDHTKGGGRRKKRISQNDSFKSPAEPKQKFRTSLIQSRLNSSKQSTTPVATTTTTTASASGVPANVKPTRRNASASVARAVALTKGTKRKSRKQTKVTETKSDSALDDRMRENQDQSGKIFESDEFRSMRFSFERVPYSEPWYSTFERQDNHSERIFEYWGNTAYRKLPFEMGPLPPLQENCCFLSKLAEFKASKKRKTKRGMGRLKAQQNSDTVDDGAGHTDDAETSDIYGCDDATSTSPSKPKTPANIVSSSNSNISTAEFVAKTLAACDEDDKGETSVLSQLLLADSSSLPAALACKKKGVLLDASGQPRKSPREHASTLAILSSLVQQQRNRIKEMNGGISPEKMPNYRAAVAAAIAAHQSSAENSGIDDHDEFNDEFEDSYASELLQTPKTKPNSESKVICSPTTRRRSNQTPVFDLRKSPISPNENGMRRGSAEHSDKFFRLRKIKRRQTDSLSSAADSTADKVDGKCNKDDKSERDMDSLKMPVDNYVDPIKLERELDQFLDANFMMADMNLDMSFNSENASIDLIASGKQNDFVELLESVKSGPLSYRTLQRTKKRHINKTGWPSLPRKRQPKREKQSEDTVHTDEDRQPSITNDDEPDRLSDIDEEDLNTVKTSPNDRQTIRSPFCDDNAVPFATFGSSSEKAENSDIFTVSSDSYLDTDMNDTVTSINPMAKQRPNSRNTDDDAESSDATAGNDDGSNTSPAAPPPPPARPTSILERALMATRSKIVRSPLIIKEAIQGINMKLQPLVCVQKMAEKDIPQITWLAANQQPPSSSAAESSSSPASAPTSPKDEEDDVEEEQEEEQEEEEEEDDVDDEEEDDDDDDEEVDDGDDDEESTGATRSGLVKMSSNRTNASPRTKVSPRKLRKPRGRWYRER